MCASLQTTQLHGFTLEILETIAPQGQRVWLVACPEMFGRAGNPYVGPDGRDWPDNAERFALFAAAIAWLGTANDGPADSAPTSCTSTIGTRRLAAALLSRAPGSARQRVQHPQPQLSGNLRPRHVRAARTAGRPMVDGGTRISRVDVVHQSRDRVRGSHHDRESDLRARNSDARIRPRTRWPDPASRWRLARDIERRRHDAVESGDRPVPATHVIRATNSRESASTSAPYKKRWGSRRATFHYSVS